MVLTTYEKIINLLLAHKASYRELSHTPEGRTDRASLIRGHSLSRAAKSMVTEVKFKGGRKLYYLAVIPGNSRVNFKLLKALKNGYDAALAPQEIAIKLTGCKMGAVPPFSFEKSLNVIVDPTLLENKEIVFNAGRLDTSIFLDTQSYIKIEKPELAFIAQSLAANIV